MDYLASLLRTYIDWNAVIWVLTIMAISLLLRALAFRRLDSVAIDMAFSSLATTFKLTILDSLNANTPSQCWRFIGCIILLLLLLLYHRYLLDSLHEKIVETINKKIDELEDYIYNLSISGKEVNKDISDRVRNNKVLLRSAIPVIKYSVMLSFTPNSRARQGKKRMREEAEKLLTSLTVDYTKNPPENIDFPKEDLLLPVKSQWLARVVFLLGGTAAFLLAVIR